MSVRLLLRNEEATLIMDRALVTVNDGTKIHIYLIVLHVLYGKTVTLVRIVIGCVNFRPAEIISENWFPLY